MNPTTPPPYQIAREAADKIRIGIRETMLNGASPLNLEALILSAAAKMVRESGAHHLEAITTDQGRLCDALHHGNGDYHSALGPCPVCLRIEAALNQLRAIGEGKP